MMASPTERMIVETDGAIGWMVFNNPARRNAISRDMWEAIPLIVEAFERDPAVRVIVLKGAGEKAFISGPTSPNSRPCAPRPRRSRRTTPSATARRRGSRMRPSPRSP